ncbi:MAG: ABC transporter ATP-binding protein [Candidatus Aminicenantes bacterium]|nr:MAG: ABC transporter ATP-binding protein [Candidatus Aminicenantes bacterium]
MNLLAIENLKVTFRTPSGQVRAVDGATLKLKEAETLALVGETGCGKSTIAHSVLSLLPENADVHGKILYDNKNLLLLHEKALARLRGKDISLVMQNPALALNPVLSIGHQMTEPLIVHLRLKKQDAILTAKSLMEKLSFKGPSNAIRAYPFEMSGGMKQRVLIGISVILSPKIIIADEPTKGLDDRLRGMILEELRLAREMNRSSMIFISHDLNAAKEISDRIAVMYAGEILESGTTQAFFKEPLHPYSKALLESLPEQGFKPVPGVPPSMIHPPRGCKFHPRCPHKKEICAKKRPVFKRTNNRDVKCVLYS